MLQTLFDYIPYILAGICILMTIVIIGCIIALVVGKKKRKSEESKQIILPAGQWNTNSTDIL